MIFRGIFFAIRAVLTTVLPGQQTRHLHTFLALGGLLGGVSFTLVSPLAGGTLLLFGSLVAWNMPRSGSLSGRGPTRGDAAVETMARVAYLYWVGALVLRGGLFEIPLWFLVLQVLSIALLTEASVVRGYRAPRLVLLNVFVGAGLAIAIVVQVVRMLQTPEAYTSSEMALWTLGGAVMVMGTLQALALLRDNSDEAQRHAGRVIQSIAINLISILIATRTGLHVITDAIFSEFQAAAGQVSEGVTASFQLPVSFGFLIGGAFLVVPWMREGTRNDLGLRLLSVGAALGVLILFGRGATAPESVEAAGLMWIAVMGSLVAYVYVSMSKEFLGDATASGSVHGVNLAGDVAGWNHFLVPAAVLISGVAVLASGLSADQRIFLAGTAILLVAIRTTMDLRSAGVAAASLVGAVGAVLVAANAVFN